MNSKATVEKTQNRAGATPLFRLSAAQANRGSLPPFGTDDVPAFFHGESKKPKIRPILGGNDVDHQEGTRNPNP